ncbi:histidine phosphatase family protein [Arvimicrobium flavum]|uniref:histidine phosphatase family protein n=1 Tax=Arvimicrobium flavum TaxID=3393320 RepID=UPI00237A0EBC|nr:histidine phosphatase family protein [Mesorhizobium shangrilense]
MIGLYLTHPQVEIDPAVPVPEWGLSAVGRRRVEAVCGAAWVRGLARIVSSEERKAVETAAILTDASGLAPGTGQDMGENDRSSTGFLAPPEFEKAADSFFAEPEASWNGWERAIDAQRRIVGAVERELAAHDPSLPILFVGHGAVGTLLKCHFAGRPISRREDQPGGGGNIHAFALADRRLLCDWTPMEQFTGIADVV